MTDRPIIFSAPMIRALLADRKTMTRRVIKPQPALASNEFIDECHHCRSGWAKWTRGNGTTCDACSCQEVKGIPVHSGAPLWVRETFSECPLKTYYRATEIDPLEVKWIPSILMPRAVSRLTLEVTGVKVERLQEISEEDAIAEGIESWHQSAEILDSEKKTDDWCRYSAKVAAQRSQPRPPAATNLGAFAMLWNSIHGPDAWDENPLVYALTFLVHKCNIDALERAA